MYKSITTISLVLVTAFLLLVLTSRSYGMILTTKGSISVEKNNRGQRIVASVKDTNRSLTAPAPFVCATLRPQVVYAILCLTNPTMMELDIIRMTSAQKGYWHQYLYNTNSDIWRVIYHPPLLEDLIDPAFIESKELLQRWVQGPVLDLVQDGSEIGIVRVFFNIEDTKYLRIHQYAGT